MSAQQSARASGVTSARGCHEPEVFVGGIALPMSGGDECHLDALRVLEQQRHLVDQQPVGAPRHQRQMEGAVSIVRGRRRRMPSSQGTVRGGDLIDEIVEAGAFRRLHRLFDGGGVEQQPHLVDLCCVVEAHRRHPCPTLGLEHHETFTGETTERLSQRSGRHTPLLRETLGDELLSRPEFAVEDGGAQQLVDPVGPRGRSLEHLGHAGERSPVALNQQSIDNGRMYRLLNINHRAALQTGDHWHDLAALSGDPSLASPMEAVARHRELHALHDATEDRNPDGAVADVELMACVPSPAKVFAIGLNYRSHAAESDMELPPAPLTFTKFPSCLVGPTADVVLSGRRVDWEVELVVAIGTGGRHIAEADAWSHVAGITLGQDISDRAVQMTGKPPQFSLGKSFDTFGPIGPALVSVDQFPNPDDIELWCEVDGERMQHARSSNLIFTVPYLVSYLSGICTLEPGDIIFTGTPDGVGAARGRFLKAGETIRSGAEVIGEMSNRCVEAGR